MWSAGWKSTQTRPLSRCLEGKTYYFCCHGCQGAFEKSPEYHLENWQEEHPGVEPTPV